jgi:hypothetical protein
VSLRCALRSKGRTAYQAESEARRHQGFRKRKEEREWRRSKAAGDAEGHGFGAGGGEFAEDGGDAKLGGAVGDVEAGGFALISG